MASQKKKRLLKRVNLAENTNKLEKSGYLFELRVNKKLSSLGIKPIQTRFMDRNEKGKEISRDVDVFGTVLSNSFEDKNRKQVHLRLSVIAEIKSWAEYCIYSFRLAEDPRNIPLPLPNYSSRILKYPPGEYILLSQLFNWFGKIPVSKQIDCLEGNKSKGNKPVFDVAKNILSACDYQHKRWNDLESNDNEKIYHGLFPIIITKAKLFDYDLKKGNKCIKKDIHFFLYLFAPASIESIALKNKYYYLPIFITDLNGIKKVRAIVKEISNKINNQLQKF